MNNLLARHLWPTVEEDGDVLDVLVQERKDTKVARRFFRKLLREQGELPLESTADKMGSHVAAKRDVMASVPYSGGLCEQSSGGFA